MSSHSAGNLLPLVARGVSKRFRQGSTCIEAIRNISLEIAQGEFVAVMGASGSGKSTLMHVIAGLTKVDEGTITIEGQSLADLSDARLTDFRRRRIGLVFQQFNLVPSLTAVQNVALPLLAGSEVNSNQARKKGIALLESLGLGDRLDHLPDALSGGEQQRIAIARSLVADPAIILADEPTGSLDSVTGQALCERLKELNEHEGRTIMVVTHEPAVAAWAKRVVIMKDGEICADFPSGHYQDAQSLASHYLEVVSRTTTEFAR